jgi:hypothetical protein
MLFYTKVPKGDRLLSDQNGAAKWSKFVTEDRLKAAQVDRNEAKGFDKNLVVVGSHNGKRFGRYTSVVVVLLT